MSLAVTLLTAWMFALGTYLVLQRVLSRIILGVSLLGHATVLLLLVMGGSSGRPAFVGPGGSTEGISAPIPQALALTAIVISFAVSGFLLAMSYRSWRSTGDDLVEDDLEDRRLAQRPADAEGHYGRPGDSIDAEDVELL